MGVAESKTHAAMGSRNSGQLTTSRHGGSERFARRTFGPEFKASAEERVGSDKDARICFENRSSYRVSYWAIEEDKTRSTAQEKRIVTDMGVALRFGNAGGKVSGNNAGRDTGGTVATGQATQGGEAQFLMRDQRIEPGAETRTADVRFPNGCRDLRVYGFFEEEGEWRLFKDKRYSIGWFSKVITLTALDKSISPYTKTRNNADATVRAICLLCICLITYIPTTTMIAPSLYANYVPGIWTAHVCLRLYICCALCTQYDGRASSCCQIFSLHYSSEASIYV